MRALRPAPDYADDDATWQAFLRDVIWETPMPDYLLYGEPYPALNGLVLTQEEHDELCRLTTLFAGVFQKATDTLAQDSAALARMGFPWVAVELLAEESMRERGPLLLGRFDFLLERDGRWQLVEYNADTPSGLREAVVVERLIARQLGLDGRALSGTGQTLAGAVKRAFLREARCAPSPPAPLPRGERGALASNGYAERPPTVGLVTDAGYAEDLAQTVFLGRLLVEAGLDVMVGDLDNVWLRRGRLCVVDRAVDAVYRYYPYETLLGQQAFADLFAAVSGGTVRLLNGLRGLLAQNKGLMAWIWARRDDANLFSREERQAIAQHLPETRWIDDPPLTAMDPGERRAVALKQVFGREGEEVYFGDAISEADWDRCRAWGSYVAQHRVMAEPVTAVIRTSRGAEVEKLWAAVGSFAVEGQWAGYYTRLGEPITTAHAKFAGTFVERSQTR